MTAVYWISMTVGVAALAVVVGLLLRGRGQHRGGERHRDRVDRLTAEGLAYSRDMEMLLRAEEPADDKEEPC